MIDGSKALRKAIDEVFGPSNPIPRCRNHTIRNVLDYLPPDRQETVRCAMKAAKLQGQEDEQTVARKIKRA